MPSSTGPQPKGHAQSHGKKPARSASRSSTPATESKSASSAGTALERRLAATANVPNRRGLDERAIHRLALRSYSRSRCVEQSHPLARARHAESDNDARTTKTLVKLHAAASEAKRVAAELRAAAADAQGPPVHPTKDIIDHGVVLDLSTCVLEGDDVVAAAFVVSAHHHITALDISAQPLTVDTGRRILEVFNANPNLVELTVKEPPEPMPPNIRHLLDNLLAAAEANRDGVSKRHDEDIKKALRWHHVRNIDRVCAEAEAMFYAEATSRAEIEQDYGAQRELILVQRHRDRQDAARRARLRNVAEVTAARSITLAERETVFRARIEMEYYTQRLVVTAEGETGARAAWAAVEERIRVVMKTEETQEWVLARRKEKARWKREAEERAALEKEERSARARLILEESQAWPVLAAEAEEARVDAEERTATRLEKQRREAAAIRRVEELERERAEREEAQRLAAMARHNLDQTKARDRMEQTAIAGRKHIKTERAAYAKMFEEAVVSIERPYLAAFHNFRVAAQRLAAHLAVVPKVTMSTVTPENAYDGHVAFIGTGSPVHPFANYGISVSLASNWASTYNECVAVLKNADAQLHSAHHALKKGVTSWTAHLVTWRASLHEAAVAAGGGAALNDSFAPLDSASAASPNGSVVEPKATQGGDMRRADTNDVAALVSYEEENVPMDSEAQQMFELVVGLMRGRLHALLVSYTSARVPAFPSADVMLQVKQTITSSRILSAPMRVTTHQQRPSGNDEKPAQLEDVAGSEPPLLAVDPANDDQQARSRKKSAAAFDPSTHWALHPCAARALPFVMRPAAQGLLHNPNGDAASSSLLSPLAAFQPGDATTTAKPPRQWRFPAVPDGAVASADVEGLFNACAAKLDVAVAANQDLLAAQASPSVNGITSPIAAFALSTTLEYEPDVGVTVYDSTTALPAAAVRGFRTLPSVDEALQAHVASAVTWEVRHRGGAADQRSFSISSCSSSDSSGEASPLVDGDELEPATGLPRLQTKAKVSTPEVLSPSSNVNSARDAPASRHQPDIRSVASHGTGAQSDSGEFSVGDGRADERGSAPFASEPPKPPPAAPWPEYMPCNNIVLLPPSTAAGGGDDSLAGSAANSATVSRRNSISKSGTFVVARRANKLANQRLAEFAMLRPAADAEAWAPWVHTFPEPTCAPAATDAKPEWRPYVLAVDIEAATFDEAVSVVVETEKAAQTAASESAMVARKTQQQGSRRQRAASSIVKHGRSASSGGKSDSESAGARTPTDKDGALDDAQETDTGRRGREESLVNWLGASGRTVSRITDALRNIAVDMADTGSVPTADWTYSRRDVVCANVACDFATPVPACLAYASGNPLDGVPPSERRVAGTAEAAGETAALPTEASSTATSRPPSATSARPNGFGSDAPRLSSALGAAVLLSAAPAPRVALTVPVTFRVPWLWTAPQCRISAFEIGAEKHSGVVLQPGQITCALPRSAPLPLAGGPHGDAASMKAALGGSHLTASFDGGTLQPADDASGGSVSPRHQHGGHLSASNVARGGASPSARSPGASPSHQRKRRLSLSSSLHGPAPQPVPPPLVGWRLVIDAETGLDLGDGNEALVPLRRGGTNATGAGCLGMLSVPPLSVLTRGRGAGQPKKQSIYVAGVAVADVVEGYLTAIVPPASSYASADFRRGDEGGKTSSRIVIEFHVGTGAAKGSAEDSAASDAWADVISALRATGSKSGGGGTAASSSSNVRLGRRASAVTPRVNISDPAEAQESSVEGMTPGAFPFASPVGGASTTNAPVDDVSIPTLAQLEEESDCVGASLLVKAVLARMRYWMPEPEPASGSASPSGTTSRSRAASPVQAPLDPRYPSQRSAAAFTHSSSRGDLNTPRTALRLLGGEGVSGTTSAVQPNVQHTLIALEDPCGARSGVTCPLFTFRREPAPTIQLSREPVPGDSGERRRRIEVAARVEPPPNVLATNSLPRRSTITIVRPFDGLTMARPSLAPGLFGHELHRVQRGGMAAIGISSSSPSSREGLGVASLPRWEWLDRARELRAFATPNYGDVTVGRGAVDWAGRDAPSASPSRPASASRFVDASQDFGLHLDMPLSSLRCDNTAPEGSRVVQTLAKPLRRGEDATAADAFFADFESAGCIVNALGVPVAIYRVTSADTQLEMRFRTKPFAQPSVDPAAHEDDSPSGGEEKSIQVQRDAAFDHRAHGLPDDDVVADILRLVAYRYPVPAVEELGKKDADRSLRLRVTRGNEQVLSSPPPVTDRRSPSRDEDAPQRSVDASQSTSRRMSLNGHATTCAPLLEQLRAVDMQASSPAQAHEPDSSLATTPTVTPGESPRPHAGDAALGLHGATSRVEACQPLLWSEFSSFTTTVAAVAPVVLPSATATEIGYAEAVVGATVKPCAALVEANRAYDEHGLSSLMFQVFVVARAAVDSTDSGTADGSLTLKRADDCNFSKLAASSSMAVFATSGAFARQLRRAIRVLRESHSTKAADELDAITSALEQTAGGSSATFGTHTKEVTLGGTAVGVAIPTPSAVTFVLSSASTTSIRRRDVASVLKSVGFQCAMPNDSPVAASHVVDFQPATCSMHLHLLGETAAVTSLPVVVEAVAPPEKMPLVFAWNALTCVGAVAPPLPGPGVPAPPPLVAGGQIPWRRPSCSWLQLHSGVTPLYVPGDTALFVAAPADVLDASRLPRRASAGTAIDIQLEGQTAPPLSAASAGLLPSDKHGRLSLAVVPPAAQPDHIRLLGSSARPSRHAARPGMLTGIDSAIASNLRVHLLPRAALRPGDCTVDITGDVSAYSIVVVVESSAGDAGAAAQGGTASTASTPSPAAKGDSRSRRRKSSAAAGASDQPVELSSAEWRQLAGKAFDVGSVCCFADASDAPLIAAEATSLGLEGSSDERPAVVIGDDDDGDGPPNANETVSVNAARRHTSQGSMSQSGAIIPIIAMGSSSSTVAGGSADDNAQGLSETGGRLTAVRRMQLRINTVAQAVPLHVVGPAMGVGISILGPGAADTPVTPSDIPVLPDAAPAGEPPAAAEGDATPAAAEEIDASAIATRGFLGQDGHALLRALLMNIGVTTVSPQQEPRAADTTPRQASSGGGGAGGMMRRRQSLSRLPNPGSMGDLQGAGARGTPSSSRPQSRQTPSHGSSLANMLRGVSLPEAAWSSTGGSLPARLTVRSWSPTVLGASTVADHPPEDEETATRSTSRRGSASASGTGHPADAQSACTTAASVQAAELAEVLRTDRNPRDAIFSKATLTFDPAVDAGGLTVDPAAVSAAAPPAHMPQEHWEHAASAAVAHVGRSLVAPPLVLPVGVMTPALGGIVQLALAALVGSSDMALALRLELSLVTFDAVPPSNIATESGGTVFRRHAWGRAPVSRLSRLDVDGCKAPAAVLPASATFDPPPAVGGHSHRLVFGFSGLERSSYAIRDNNLVCGGMSFVAAIDGPHNWSKNPAHALLPIPAHPGPAKITVTFGPQHKTARAKHLGDVWRGITLALLPAERAGARGGRMASLVAAALASSGRSDPSATPTATPGVTPRASSARDSSQLPPTTPKTPGSVSSLTTSQQQGAQQRPVAIRIVVHDGASDPLVCFIPVVLDWGVQTSAAAPHPPAPGTPQSSETPRS